MLEKECFSTHLHLYQVGWLALSKASGVFAFDITLMVARQRVRASFPSTLLTQQGLLQYQRADTSRNVPFHVDFCTCSLRKLRFHDYPWIRFPSIIRAFFNTLGPIHWGIFPSKWTFACKNEIKWINFGLIWTPEDARQIPYCFQ